MVKWQEEGMPEEAGEKARNLSRLEALPVPEFFVVTPEELGRLFSGGEPRTAELDSEMKQELEEAFSRVGMSSEVRGASDKARELVGGQRESQPVSIRVSNSGTGYEYRLNVGPSGFFQDLRKVASDYLETEGEMPALIVQKMVEPDFTGAAIMNYSRELELVEIVKGLGTTLERGITKPHLYLLRNGEVVDSSPAENHTYTVRNPATGEHETRTQEESGLPLKPSQVEKMVEELRRTNMNAKFVFSRGTFRIVDASEGGSPGPGEKTTDYIRASQEKPSGRAGEDFEFTDKPLGNGTPFVSKLGGYTSARTQAAREQGTPCLVRYQGDLREGEALRDEKEKEAPSDPAEGMEPGTQVLELNPRSGRGLHTSPPFGEGYCVTERLSPGNRIPKSGHITRYRDFFGFDGESAVVDARRLADDGLEEALTYLEAETKILILEPEFEEETVRLAVENGFDAISTDSVSLGRLRREVKRQERKFILERIHELD